jgi:hypothetical protein
MRHPDPCSVLVCGALCVLSLGTATSGADGLPVLGVDVGASGVAAPAGDARYVTVPAGRETVVERVDPHGGRVLASALLKGRFTVPAVAYDGSASGLSADGRTLVLIEPRLSFPRAETTLRLLDTRPLRPSRFVRLHGDFSFDAVSPRGRWLYLIQYLSPADPTRYLVRVFDLRTGRLLAAPVTDPRKAGEKMRGSPLTRATSPDGRWAYTLYDGAGKTPFVHALDTTRHTARCIDLDTLAGTDLSQLHLRLNGAASTLTVSNHRQPVAIIDTRTFKASAPLPTSSGTSAREARHDGTGIPWTLLSASSATALMRRLSTMTVAFRLSVLAAALVAAVAIGTTVRPKR